MNDPIVTKITTSWNDDQTRITIVAEGENLASHGLIKIEAGYEPNNYYYGPDNNSMAIVYPDHVNHKFLYIRAVPLGSDYRDVSSGEMFAVAEIKHPILGIVKTCDGDKNIIDFIKVEKGKPVERFKQGERIKIIQPCPEPVDAGEWGVLYYLQDGVEKTWQLQSEEEFNSLTEWQITPEITKFMVTRYTFGTEPTALPDGWMGSCNMSSIDGWENLKKLRTIGSSVFSWCGNLDCPINIPEGVISIGDNFLMSCNGLTHEVHLPNTLQTIGHNFMSYLYYYNQPITIPDSVTEIGDSFLYSMSGLNSPITLSKSLVKIGSYAFDSLTLYNQPLVLPDSLKEIGSFFFQAPMSFAQPITLPSSIESIGEVFMHNQFNFVGPLTINTTCPPPQDSMYWPTLSSNGSSAQAYQQGITITGPGAAAWKSALPDIDDRRKLILA